MGTPISLWALPFLPGSISGFLSFFWRQEQIMATVQVQVNDEDFMARRTSPGAQLGQVQVGDTVFGSRDDALADIKAAFIEKKVALVIRQSNSKRGTVILGCDRGGKPKNCRNLTPETRKNNKGSRLTGCKFTVSLKQYFTDDGAEMWLITKSSGCCGSCFVCSGCCSSCFVCSVLWTVLFQFAPTVEVWDSSRKLNETGV